MICGAGVGAEGPTRLRGLRSSQFAPQRVVAVTRAPHLFYRRPRAFRRPAGASAGEVPPRGARGGGERQWSKGGGAPSASPPERTAKKAERSRPETKRRCWGRVDCWGATQDGEVGRAPEMGVGGAVESLPPPGRAELLQPPRPPRSLDSPILPLPALHGLFCTLPLHPSARGSPSRTAAKGGAGSIAAARLGCCASRPEKRPVSKNEITVCFSSF